MGDEVEQKGREIQDKMGPGSQASLVCTDAEELIKVLLESTPWAAGLPTAITNMYLLFQKQARLGLLKCICVSDQE